MGFMDKMKNAADKAIEVKDKAVEAKKTLDDGRMDSNIPIGVFNSGKGSLTLHTQEITYHGKDGGTMSLDGVTARVESGEELQSRVTVTRLILVGVFAFALKKKSGGEKYLTVEGKEKVFAMEVDRKHVNDAVKFAAKINSAAKQYSVYYGSQESPSSSSDSSAADELLKFKQLLDAGAITQEEFNAKKAELL